MKTLTSICVVTIVVLATLHGPGAVLAASGSGTQQPKVSLSTNRVYFWYYPRCFASTNPVTVTLTNNGPGVLDITSIAISGPFSQTHTCGSTLGVGRLLQHFGHVAKTHGKWFARRHGQRRRQPAECAFIGILSVP